MRGGGSSRQATSKRVQTSSIHFLRVSGKESLGSGFSGPMLISRGWRPHPDDSAPVRPLSCASSSLFQVSRINSSLRLMVRSQ